LGRTGSDISVFHSPHAAHCPCHLGEDAPQFWQINASLVFAISFLGSICELSIAVRQARSPILRGL
jgi:hypothetical protein